MAGYNLTEFSIADKGMDKFEGIVFITYDVTEDLLDSKNQKKLISKIKDGLKKLHDFDSLRTDELRSTTDPLIGRQIKYTSKVYITVPSSKQKNKDFVFDVKTQAQDVSEKFSSDISSLTINTSLHRTIEHNEVTEEELLLAESLANIDDLFIAEDDMTDALFQASRQSICIDQRYGEVYENHFLAGIAQFGINKFIPRFKRYAYLSFLKKEAALNRGKKQKTNTDEQNLDSLLKQYSDEYSKDRDPDQLIKEKPKKTKKESTPQIKGNTKKGTPPQKKGNAKKSATVAEPDVLDEIRDNLNSIMLSNPSEYEPQVGDETFDGLMLQINWEEVMNAIGVTIVGLNDV